MTPLEIILVSIVLILSIAVGFSSHLIKWVLAYAQHDVEIAQAHAQHTITKAQNRVMEIHDALMVFHQAGGAITRFEIEKAQLELDKYKALTKQALELGNQEPKVKEIGEQLPGKFGSKGHTRQDLNPIKQHVDI